MTIACPMFCDMRCARIRAALSTALAAARGTIICIVLFGYADCAHAPGALAASVAASSMRRAMRRLVAMNSPVTGSGELVASMMRRLHEPRDTEFVGEPTEILQQSRGQRDAVARVFATFGAALLSRQPDTIDVRHAAAAMQVVDQRIDTILERIRVAESCNVDGDNRLAGVGGAGVVVIEVDHVLAHRSAVQRSGEQADDECESVTLVSADRQEETLFGAARIGERLPVTIDHPALGHRLAALRL